MSQSTDSTYDNIFLHTDGSQESFNDVATACRQGLGRL